MPDSHRRARVLVTAVDELFGTHTLRVVLVAVREGACVCEPWVACRAHTKVMFGFVRVEWRAR